MPRSCCRCRTLPLVLLCASAVAATSATAQSASEFHELCRGGTLLGSGYDAVTGLYDWTCATENTDWHGSIDPSQTTASHLVHCVAPGEPHPTCLGTEDRMIGAVHQIGMAAARTRPGGTVYVPNFAGKNYAIWVDDGCGTLADGATRAKCPPAYTPQWRHLPHFAQSGPHVRGDRVQANRGVRIVAEGTPDAVELAPGSFQLVGGWLVVDTGNVESRKGPGPIALDGEDADLVLDTFRFVTGGAKWQRYCHNTDNGSLACDLRGVPGREYQWSGEDVWVSGAEGRIVANYDASAGSEVCLDDTVGHAPTLTTGTCRGDRRYLCWDADGDGDTNETRADGSCRWTGVTPNVDLGPCDGFVTALEHDRTVIPDLRLAFRLSQCSEPADSAEDCTPLHGHASTLAAIADVPAVSCGGSGRIVQLDASSMLPAPLPDFAAGGSPNDVFVTTESLYDQVDGGFYHFGFMPGNWFGQVHAGDVRFSGVTLSQGSTDTLEFASPGWAADQWQGLTAVIDPAGLESGPLYQTIAGNDDDTLHLTMATGDVGCAPEPCTETANAGIVQPGDVVEIRAGMCSGSFHGGGKGTSDETVCDQSVLTGNFAARGAGFYGSLHFLCSAPNGGPACADANSLNVASARYWDGSIWRARRGFLADMSGDHMRNYSFRESKAGTFLSNFSSFGLNENISFVDNDYRTLVQLGQNIRGATFRDIHLSNNVGGGAYEFLLLAGRDLTFERIESYGGTRSTFMIIEPRAFGDGPETSDMRNLVLRDLHAVGQLGEKFTRQPAAAIFVNVNPTGYDTESIDGLTIDNAVFEGTSPNQCGIWLEDDHSPGAVLPHMEQSRPSMLIRNVQVAAASGTPRAVCSGDSRGSPRDDSTTSAATFAEAHAPVLENATHVTGSAEGGLIAIAVDGTVIVVLTTAGQTPGEIAQAIAAVVTGHSGLSALGISAYVVGRTVVANAHLVALAVTDPGLTFESGPAPPPPVPVSGVVSLLVLAAALTVRGVAALVRRS